MEQYETPLSHSSSLVHLRLEKRFRTFDTSQVYSIYDKRSNSLDTWGVSKNSTLEEEDPPLNTKKMHHLHSRDFSKDENFSLMTLLLSRGVEPFCFLLDPLVKISLHGVFVPYPFDGLDTFPHSVSVTISPSRIIYQDKHQQKCHKITKGCLFVFTKLSLTEQLDYNLVKFREFKIPNFVFDRICKDLSERDPRNYQICFVGGRCNLLFSPEEDLLALKQHLVDLPMKMDFQTNHYLVVLVLCSHFMLQLNLLGFCRRHLQIHGKRMHMAKVSKDPTKYVMALLDFKDELL